MFWLMHLFGQNCDSVHLKVICNINSIPMAKQAAKQLRELTLLAVAKSDLWFEKILC